MSAVRVTLQAQMSEGSSNVPAVKSTLVFTHWVPEKENTHSNVEDGRRKGACSHMSGMMGSVLQGRWLHAN